MTLIVLEFLWKGLGKTEFFSWPTDWSFDKWNICLTVHIHWKVLMQFYMDKSHSLSTPMIMRSLDINDDSVWSQKKDEELLGNETPYLGVIRALVHLTTIYGQMFVLQ